MLWRPRFKDWRNTGADGDGGSSRGGRRGDKRNNTRQVGETETKGKEEKRATTLLHRIMSGGGGREGAEGRGGERAGDRSRR